MSDPGSSRDVSGLSESSRQQERSEGDARTPGTPLPPSTPSQNAAGTPRSASGAASVASSDRGRVRGDIGRDSEAYAFLSQRSGGIPGTPSTPGSRIRTPTSARYEQAPSSTDAEDRSGSLVNETVLWGTTVKAADVMQSFESFLRNFTKEGDETSHDGASYFENIFKTLYETEVSYLNLDCELLAKYRPDGMKLYNQLIRYPSEVIPLLDSVATDVYADINDVAATDILTSIQVRPYNLQFVKTMRTLSPSDVGNLINLRGMVVRVSSIIPDLQEAFFRCTLCGHSLRIPVVKGVVEDPAVCEECQARYSMNIVHNLCIFGDKQLIKIQEAPEATSEGETPHTLMVYAFDDMVDTVMPGDRVEITGVFRALPVRVNPRQRTLKSVYKTYVDAVHFAKSVKGRLRAEDSSKKAEEEFAPRFYEDIESLETLDNTMHDRDPRAAAMTEMANQPNLYERLARSLAPSIWELDDIKKGLLLMLFGGVNKNLGDHGKHRGEINILLCGDPGTSKSQLLGYVHKIAPRGIYTSGKGSSAVGLTAYVTRDPETREPILESGALVLSDRGVCCIDEFDKMNDSTRSILHEVMEQQTVSVAKAGIICSLNARTSILASANPVNSRYDPHMSVVENIQLPPTLLSRFDLIYLVLDKPNPETDRQLAKHLVSLYYDPSQAREKDDEELFTISQVAQYISYARANVRPRISNEAVEELVDGYVGMRRMGNQGGSTGKKIITATPRQLQSLIRLAEAHARMQLKEEVGKDDVVEAIRLMACATQQAATDPRTGTIDMDLINTGRSALAAAGVRELVDRIRDALATRSGRRTIPLREVLSELTATGTEASEEEIEDALATMQEEGYLTYNKRKKTLNVSLQL